jgi:flagellar hook-basal body complex protein FliE
MDALLARFETARAAVTGSSPRAEGAMPGKLVQGAATTGGVDFGALLRKSLDQVDQMQGTAAKLADRFQLEDPAVSLEDTMVALQKANVTFQAALQVRNKVVAAYHDIMNMQI